MYLSSLALATNRRTKSRFLRGNPLKFFLSVLLAIALAGCEQKDTLQEIKQRGYLTVVTRTSPTTYYRDNSGPTGFEYQLAQRFADQLGVELKVVTESTISGIFRNLREGTADFASAGLSLSAARAREFSHSQSYFEVQPLVIYQSGQYRPSSISDLYDRTVLVTANSSHLELLEQLHESHPRLRWRVIASSDSADLLDLISEDTPFAIVDDYDFALQQPLFPRLKEAFSFGDTQHLVWFITNDSQSDTLTEAANLFLTEVTSDGVLRGLAEEFFSYEPLVSRAGTFTFSQNMDTVLPDYENMIRQVAHEYNIDWNLLAAMAYQESHWDPKAKSFTGVRGMMMLTQRTARELNVKNRLDPLESLRGGARYLNKLKRRLDPAITEPDRTYMAMAAYNIGMGHLQDARKLTTQKGGNPMVWGDLMQHLPKLQKPSYYRTLRFGYARGAEAVTYVQNIRHYANILLWRDITQGQEIEPHNSRDFLPETLQELRLLGL